MLSKISDDLLQIIVLQVSLHVFRKGAPSVWCQCHLGKMICLGFTQAHSFLRQSLTRRHKRADNRRTVAEGQTNPLVAESTLARDRWTSTPSSSCLLSTPGPDSPRIPGLDPRWRCWARLSVACWSSRIAFPGSDCPWRRVAARVPLRRWVSPRPFPRRELRESAEFKLPRNS